MDPTEQTTNKEKMIKNLELELNDLRQGRTTLKDYYCQLEELTKNQEAAESIEEEIVRPQVDDEKEFDAIWQFHKDMLIADPAAAVPLAEMYDKFVQFCKKTSLHPVDISAFNFIFARMEDPQPLLDKGAWKGYRFKDI
jgi:DICT domain-containing protein